MRFWFNYRYYYNGVQVLRATNILYFKPTYSKAPKFKVEKYNKLCQYSKSKYLDGRFTAHFHFVFIKIDVILSELIIFTLNCSYIYTVLFFFIVAALTYRLPIV